MAKVTKATLLFTMNQLLPDNDQQEISAEDLRNVLTDMIDSLCSNGGEVNISGRLRYSAAFLLDNDLDLIYKGSLPDLLANYLTQGTNTLTEPLTLEGDSVNVDREPTTDNQVTNKQYSDRKNLRGIIYPNSTFYVFGDSISQNNSVADGYGWEDLFTGATGTNQNNKSVAGRGAYRAVKNAYESWTVNNKSAMSWMAAFNDLRQSNDPLTYLKIKGCLRAFIANAFLKTATLAEAVTLSNPGGPDWVYFSGNGNKSGTLGGTPIQSDVVGATATHTFSGSSLVIGTWGVDGVVTKGGTFTVTVDGTLIDTFNMNGQSDTAPGDPDGATISQHALVYTNLGNDDHTVVVEITNVLSGGNVYLDFFGTLQSPNECPTVLVFDIPKMNSAGYATAPANASDAVFDAGDVAQQEVIDEFAEYPVFRAFTNHYYDVTTGLGPDNIHPNVTGYAQIFKAGIEKVHQTPTTIYGTITVVSPDPGSGLNILSDPAGRALSILDMDSPTGNGNAIAAGVKSSGGNTQNTISSYSNAGSGILSPLVLETTDFYIGANINTLGSVKFSPTSMGLDIYFHNGVDYVLLTSFSI